MALFAAGDVAYDVATRGQADSTGYPWADLLYLLGVPVHRLSRCTCSRASTSGATRRSTVRSSRSAASAVIWQWVVTPVVTTGDGRDARADRRRGVSDHGRAARRRDRARRLHAPAMGAGGLVPVRWARRDAHRRHRLRAARRRRQLHGRQPARRALAHRLLPVRGRGVASVDARALGTRATRVSCVTDARA